MYIEKKYVKWEKKAQRADAQH